MISQPQDLSNEQPSQVTSVLSQREASVGTPLQRQTAELMKVLATGDTGTTYKNALVTSLHVLKIFAIWLFQVALTVFAVLVWLWGIGYQGGYLFRKWIEVNSPSTSELVCTVLKTVAAPFVRLYEWAADFVAVSFGWDVQFKCLETEPPKEDSETAADIPEPPAKEEEAPKSEDCEAVEDEPTVVEECG